MMTSIARQLVKHSAGVAKGAYDDVKAAGEALMPILKKSGMYERKHYLNNSSDSDAFNLS
jgi:hypothetical protein